MEEVQLKFYKKMYEVYKAENKELKDEFDSELKLCGKCTSFEDLKQENKELQDRIENLNLIVSNQVIESYDIDTPLKEQLNKERLRNAGTEGVLEETIKQLQDKLDKIAKYTTNNSAFAEDWNSNIEAFEVMKIIVGVNRI